MNFDRILFLDAETRWSRSACSWAPDGYTLSKMTTEEYIRSPLFKAFGFCYKWYGEDGAAVWIRHEQLEAFFNGIDWSRTAVCMHNAQFDCAILTWIYGHKPAFIFDTLSMARALRGIEVGNSAAKLADDFGLPAKGRATHSTDGLYELPFEVEVELADYCRHDVYLCEQFFIRLSDGYPVKELKLIDATIRMFTEPQLMLDTELLTEAIDEDEKLRGELLGRLGIAESQLASNEMFAEVLRGIGVDPPTKISPTTGKEAYAFAKNDALFQSLLNGDNETAVLLCEARMKVKSTQERTRAQRFLDIAGRGQGLLPVPVNYAHTRTLRWGAAKGSNINMQNMKRGGKLRKSVIAQAGHQCVAGDLSQIEPRVLAYLSDFKELLEIFASGKDAYAQFGSTMFGIPGLTKETHADLRQSAKSALLGCFAPDTQVLTDSGWKAIISVSRSDLLWDGEEWVTHTGTICQGLKTVFRFRGLAATADHEILTAHGWQEWNEVRTNHSLFQSALKLAHLPSPTGDAHSYLSLAEQCTSLSYAANADGKGLSHEVTLSEAEVQDVTPAQRKNQRKPASIISSTRLSLKMHSIGHDFSTAFTPLLQDAKTLMQNRIQTTAEEAYACFRSGLKIGQNFFAISSLSMAGTTPNCSLTGVTTTKAMSQGIFDSVRAVLTWLTSARSKLGTLKNSSENLQNSNERTLTYDISNAGPRNRFTVLTDDGPIIVHNCGYQLGWASFAAQLLVGFLGAPPVRYDRAFMKQLGIGGDEVRKFLDGKWGEENLNRMLEIPHTCTDEELLVHCVCAKEIIDRYRKASAPVVEFWGFLEKMIATVLADPQAEPVEYKCLTFYPGKIKLPNGLFIFYDKIKVELDEKNRPRYSYWNGKTYKNLYAGVVCENVTSGTARCVIGDGMIRVQSRYPVALTVHDEIVIHVPDEQVDDAKVWTKQQLIAPVRYLPNIPLNAEVGAHRRYGLAK